MFSVTSLVYFGSQLTQNIFKAMNDIEIGFVFFFSSPKTAKKKRYERADTKHEYYIPWSKVKSSKDAESEDHFISTKIIRVSQCTQ